MKRFARIVATIGPSSSDEKTLRQLIQAGMDVARLNFSHGTQAEHAERISLLRRLSDELGKPISILQDLQGPKLRIGSLPQGTIILTAGQMVHLTMAENTPADSKQGELITIPFDVPELNRIVRQGSHILLDDGHLELEIIHVTDDDLQAKVILGGPLSSQKGVNLPGAHLPIPGFTEKDREDLAFGLSKGVDAVAISFVQTADDIQIVRKAIKEIAPKQVDTPIIAKLERPEALDHLNEILQVADGVMVARGDLGVEMSPAFVPIAQKKIIRAANEYARIVITATQMLDSMINNPRPTRAEASDVANAIFDGTDAVMLSGETASGKYPLESVVMMDSIVSEAEAHIAEWGRGANTYEDIKLDNAVAMAKAARELAHDRKVEAIVVFTRTLMAKSHPDVPIMAFTPQIRTYNRLGLYWGVIPFLVPYASSVETMIDHVESAIIKSTNIQPGQQVVLISGFPVGTFSQPNLALLYTVCGANQQFD
jgi:pyruvate kinase